MDLAKETKLEMARISREIAAVARSGPALPGTLTRRFTRCGHEGCKCRAKTPVLHGPYWSWTRKINNKTATRILSDEEVTEFGVMFDNAKRLRTLVAELEALSLTALESHRVNTTPTTRSNSKIA